MNTWCSKSVVVMVDQERLPRSQFRISISPRNTRWVGVVWAGSKVTSKPTIKGFLKQDGPSLDAGGNTEDGTGTEICSTEGKDYLSPPPFSLLLPTVHDHM